MSTFEQWLRKQKDRDDEIGDLAKDFIDTNKRSHEKRVGFSCRKLTEELMRRLSASEPAIEAFKKAKKEYGSYMRINND